jgi:ethanolamine kinase
MVTSNATSESGIKSYEIEMDPVNEKLLKEQTLEILKDLRPKWDLNLLEFKTFTKGITNRIFCITYPDEPNDKMIFRVFGKNTDKVIDRLHEMDTITKLEKVGIAAPLHAKFRNGIICGYLEDETLDSSTVRKPEIIEKICEAMARMHQIPLEKDEQPFIFDKMRQFLDNLPKSFPSEKKNLLYKRYFESNDLEEQFEHLKQLLTALDNPIVFCHNDLLVYNILYDDKKESIHFIDYEYASPNYQLFEIANHFCEYAGVDEPDYSLCPTEEEKKEFIQKYLTFYQNRVPTSEELNHTLAMVPFFEAVCVFFYFTSFFFNKL